MTLEPYRGLCPSNVAQDAKYSMSVAGEVRLSYRIDARTRDLLTTDAHPTLAKMVNAAKEQVNGRPGGVFYINEFSTVVVPGKPPTVNALLTEKAPVVVPRNCRASPVALGSPDSIVAKLIAIGPESSINTAGCVVEAVEIVLTELALMMPAVSARSPVAPASASEMFRFSNVEVLPGA